MATKATIYWGTAHVAHGLKMVDVPAKIATIYDSMPDVATVDQALTVAEKIDATIGNDESIDQ